MDECFFLARVCLAGIILKKKQKNDLIVKKEIVFRKKYFG